MVYSRPKNDVVVHTFKHKVVIKILQGSVLTQTVLDGLINYVYPPVANLLQCMCQNFDGWLALDKDIAIIVNGLHFWTTL